MSAHGPTQRRATLGRPQASASVSFLYRRVLARELRRGDALAALLRPLEPGGTSPGALELVAYLDAQLAEALGLELHRVAVHEARQAAMVGAGGEDVARLERVDRSHPFDRA